MTQVEPAYGRAGQLTETVTTDDAQYALSLVKAICKDVGPGLPGSYQERERAAILRKELKSHLDAGNVFVEDFTVAAGAFLGSLRICGLFILIAAILNISAGRFTEITTWISATIALTLSTFSVLMVVFEFVFYREFVDTFFEKSQSENVVGTLRSPGTKNVKRLLIVSGHHDSALDNTWAGLPGYALYFTGVCIFIGLGTMLVMSIIQLVGVITGNASIVNIGTLGWVMFVFPIIPSIIFALFFNRGRKNGGTVPGAADNLSGSALAVAMCRFLARNPSHIPTDTEIRFISFGSEEAGLRGSRRYVERHIDELKHLDARLLNFEVVAYPEIAILTSDVNGTVKNSSEMVQSVVAAARGAGVPFKVNPYPAFGGGSDAGSFSRAGLKASTLLPLKVPQQIMAFYHQKKDTPEVLTLEPLLNVLKLTFEWMSAGGE